MPKSAKIVTI